MKLLILAMCFLLTLTKGSNIAHAAITTASNPIWQEKLNEYSANNRVKQVIFVQYQGGSDALVRLYEKDSARSWQLTLECDGYVGKAGLGKTVEGDMKTPVGDFGIFTAGGIEPNPGTKASYLLFDEHVFCADGQFYNKLIDDRKIPHELLKTLNLDPMNDGAPQFNYGLFIDYNKECIRGRGSYIFLHCTGDADYTHGCVAVSEADMVNIMRRVDNNVRICIYPM
ncbi:hypothetical protein D081_2132 [Anaerovibrio sp. JC8]|uniref:L,D-transpeptidase family protein n=1 Tax=Anaerovibrio sp. JC8 TaxID=1240085 RepID=UPI000A0C8886|nr:L,D-transpeptidase family protein [Anaerovibrio sp. JC8]ORT99162.1 hypothetical protein D081_2132 [Anaerovibrio sp. JC8]